MRLARLELWSDRPIDVAALAARFPALAIAQVAAVGPDALTACAWRAEELDFWAFDRALDALALRGAPLQLAITVADADAVITEVLLRAQRLAPHRTITAPWFDRLLAAHHARHAVDKPLVRADLDHALDAWQWALRLDGAAPVAVQLAALLHDLERLASEPDARIEHQAPDYQAFKDAHARAGARLAEAMLVEVGAPPAVIAATTALIARHERPGDDPALRAVNDADALSFFAFNSPGYLAYFGPAQTARKIAYTVARMSARARGELAAVRMPRFVREELERAHGQPQRA